METVPRVSMKKPPLGYSRYLILCFEIIQISKYIRDKRGRWTTETRKQFKKLHGEVTSEEVAEILERKYKKPSNLKAFTADVVKRNPSESDVDFVMFVVSVFV